MRLVWNEGSYIYLPSGAIPSLLKVVKTNPLHFRIQMKGFENIDIEPFYKIHFERYAVYWPVTL